MSSSPPSWILIPILMILFNQETPNVFFSSIMDTDSNPYDSIHSAAQVRAEVIPLCNPNKYPDQSPYAVHLYLVLSELRYGYVSSSRLEPDVYGRVDCDPDQGDCVSCANRLLDELEEACDHDMGGQVADDVCSVRYEPYSF
ncbi:uncharacterized protein A4U43_UnF3260 [Asparagus officinalis]|uniref:Gnk2-homologous domain-containing protein n=1 Tax=Asparagus officinalis TaxID=4686 RepID=A0A1R3L740_ASPOF|nr:uncharacterized protein A4U43_UnF3260 [Asparagus officinalis]